MEVKVSALCIITQHRFGCAVADGVLYVPSDVKRFMEIHGLQSACSLLEFVKTHVSEVAITFGWEPKGVHIAWIGLCDVLRGHIPESYTETGIKLRVIR